MILLIDNYDSFTYNLYQAVAVYAQDVIVLRNDAVDASMLQKRKQLSSLPAPVTQKMQASLLPLSRNSAEPFQF